MLTAIATVQRLDEAEISYLRDLAQAPQPGPIIPHRKPARETGFRPSLQRLLDSITGSAVWIRDERMDLIAANALGKAVYASVLDDPSSRGGNNALFAFLSPAARICYVDWDKGADDMVATLRLGRNPRETPSDDRLKLLGSLTADQSSRDAHAARTRST